MSYVIGIDLGTSSVKALLVDRDGNVVGEASRPYPLLHEQPGWSEQRPEDWVQETAAALRELLDGAAVNPELIEGVSFSGQMHGLVLLDKDGRVLRNAILWNDTRTTAQCRKIERTLGERLLSVTKNAALEGFTLPKLLWVQEHEPELLAKAAVFLLPKDYLRYRMTGGLHMDYSDAAGTLLLDVAEKRWSADICAAFGLDPALCPPLVESFDCVGGVLPEFAEQSGLLPGTKVFAGGADNACGALGAGIVREGAALASIGTSGVVLTYENDRTRDFGGKVHFFNHAKRDAFYAMGVTLAAGYSLSWFRNTFAAGESYDELLKGTGQVPPGSRGLLFTPYLVGERTPHADAVIRASFIGLDGAHTRTDLARAVMEGITFSLHESICLFREAGKTVDRIVSIGGGAKNDVWLQMQADVFNAEVIRLKSEQGPALGAAMLAAYGCGWFASLEACADRFVAADRSFFPQPDAVRVYSELFSVYKQVYQQTKPLNEQLQRFRK